MMGFTAFIPAQNKEADLRSPWDRVLKEIEELKQ
jgi:hypothetical protein